MQESASDYDDPVRGVPAKTGPRGRDSVGAECRDTAAYDRAWARFARFCADRGEAALPASADTLSAFLLKSARGRAGLGRYLVAIDHKHRLHGFAPPGRDPGLHAALRLAGKTAPCLSRHPAPTPAQLHRLAQSCPGDLAGRRDRALLLLVSAGLGRAALVGLQAEQLRFTKRSVTCVVTGAAEGRQVEVERSVAMACPVRALEDWLRLSATRYGPVFRKVNRCRLGHAALGTDAVRLIVARRTAGLR